jgi:tripartite-type tricarboxylate transporter receptor subunit TctC
MNYFARSVQAASLIVAGTLAALAPAKAQDFAGKQIRVIVPFNAGGGTDISARLFAQKLTESLKANVIVENKAGGNLIPAGREVAGAQPDGLTLYFISTSAIIAQALYSDYPLDLRKFAAVSEVSAGPLILVARNDLGAKTFPEIVEMAKKSPGKLKFGTGGGTASSLFLATELFKSTTGVNVNIVPYRGSGPALNDMLGGHIDAMFDFMPQMTARCRAARSPRSP